MHLYVYCRKQKSLGDSAEKIFPSAAEMSNLLCENRPIQLQNLKKPCHDDDDVVSNKLFCIHLVSVIDRWCCD